MIKVLISVTLLLLPKNILAVNLAVGTIASTGKAGLTVQQTFDEGSQAWSAAYYFLAEDSASLSVDWQQLTRPLFLPPMWRLYYGAGFLAETHADEKKQELYFVRLPVGAQYRLFEMSAHVFGEAVPTIGSGEGSSMEVPLAIGARATF